MKALGNKTEIYMSNDTSLSVEAAHVPATRLRTVWLVFFGCAALNSLSYIYDKRMRDLPMKIILLIAVLVTPKAKNY